MHLLLTSKYNLASSNTPTSHTSACDPHRTSTTKKGHGTIPSRYFNFNASFTRILEAS